MEAVRSEVSVSSPDRIEEIVWFHDADFDVDEISFDKAKQTVTIVFDQAVSWLPSDLGLPPIDCKGHGWLGYLRFRELMPFVECELVVRGASRFTLDGNQTWGVLDDASFDSDRQVVRINSVIGPNIDVHVKRFDVAVRASDRVRAYRRITTWFCIFESSGKRIPA